ncbi:hypothetical protein Sjap_023988 [Stephania japonica]|uniref:C3H1-type domain-containing protein n=1 Tax=Stephania japonica TaxID=461633 RepID=A0AAP0HNI7_9MAGN
MDSNPSSTPTPSDHQVCLFVRKPKKSSIRRRPNDDDDDEEEEEESRGRLSQQKPNKKAQRTGNDNNLFFSTTRPQDDPNPNNTQIFEFESSKDIQVHHDSRATATLETETDFSRDARAIRERVLKQAQEALTGSQQHQKQIYKGIHGYTDYKAGFRREHTVAGEKAGGAHGPLRASAHIRVSARFDYQPDICKDYKETGYCGFGDSCKFMHDRGDYKSGWQLDREWEDKEKERKRNLALLPHDHDDDHDHDHDNHDAQRNPNPNHGDDDDDDNEDDPLPFACFICRQPFLDPVVTKCKHYFCEHCALKVTSPSLVLNFIH